MYLNDCVGDGGFVGLYLSHDFSANPYWLALVQQWTSVFDAK